MKKLFLTSTLFLSALFAFAQPSAQPTKPEYTKIVLNNDSIIQADLFFSTTEYYYFKRYGYTDENIYRVATSQVKSCDHNKNKGELNIGFEFIKFSKQAQAGIILSLIGTATMIVLPIVAVATVAAIPGGAIALIGFIVWADSYSHTKKIGIIMSAKDYSLP